MDMSKKSLGEPGVAPITCPHCGKKMADRGWILSGGELLCLACNQKITIE